MRPEEWTIRAACNSPLVEPDWWYSEKGFGKEVTEDTPAMRKALFRCFRCPVRRECLTHALTYNERWGTWGGIRQTERRRLIAHLRMRPQDMTEIIQDALVNSEARARKEGLAA